MKAQAGAGYPVSRPPLPAGPSGSAPSTHNAPRTPGDRLQRAALTTLLATLAVAGNGFNLTLFFGVEILFGSVATLLALVWLGTWPAVLVAAAGGAYTFVLWGHPYALIVLVAEAMAVGWHRDWARRRGILPPPIAVSVALYWTLVGIPLVVLFYHWGLGLAWPQVLLVALKQPVNGIFNAALAGLVLVAAQALLQRQSRLPVGQVLFSVLLAGALIPSLALTAWENLDLKDRREGYTAERLFLFGRLAAHHLEMSRLGSPRKTLHLDLDSELADLKSLLRDALPQGTDPMLWLAAKSIADPTAGPKGDAPIAPPQAFAEIPTHTPGLSLRIPSTSQGPRMAQWHQARYRMQIREVPGLPGYVLNLEISASPLIDTLQTTVSRLLALLLAMTLIGVLIAQRLSLWLVRPLQRLVETSRALPEAIREGKPWPAPIGGLYTETGQLADAVGEMARSLATSFGALEGEKERLRRSAASLENAQSIAHMGSWELEISTGTMTWSDESYRLLGYAPGAVEPSRASFLAAVPAGDHLACEAAFAAALERPEGRYRLEHRALGPDGVPRILLAEGRTTFDAQGRPFRVAGTSLEVTQRRATEDALRAQQERYRLVVDNVEDIIVRTDATGRFEFVSPSYCATFGLPESELIGRLNLPEVHPDDRSSTEEAVAALFRPPHSCRIEHRARTGMGWRWFQWSDRALLNEAGQVVAIVAVGRDTTERKAAELAVVQRESMVSELLALAADLVKLSDNEIDAAIVRALGRIGRFIRADRSYLFLVDERAGTLGNTHEWTTDTVDPAIDRCQGLTDADMPALAARLRAGEPVAIPVVAALGADWAAERAIFESQEIRSLLIVPLVLGDTLLGLVGLDAVSEARDWSEVEVHFLQTFANLMAGTLDRARTTEALRTSYERYDQVARQTRTVTWEVDTRGCYSYISPICEQVIGYRAEELIGKPFYELVPLSRRMSVRAAARESLSRRGVIKDWINPILTADGRHIWLSTNGAPRYAPDGTLLGYRGIDTDISERYRAEERLRESEARLGAVFDNAPLGMALVGPDGRVTLANRALGAFLGCDPAIVAGMPVYGMSPPADRRGDRAIVADLMAGRLESYRATKRYRRMDGQEVWGDLRVTMLPSRQGEPPSPIGMVEDVTELYVANEQRQALEDALGRYTTQLEELVDVVNLPLAPLEQVRALLRLGCRSLGMMAAVLGELDGGHRVLAAVRDDDPEGRLPSVGRHVLEELLRHQGQPGVLRSEQLSGSTVAAGFASCIGLAFDCPRPDGPPDTLILTLWSAEASLELGGPERQILRLVAQRVAAVRHEERMQRDLVIAKERETIGHLASGVAHDFNNLLGVIDANLFYLEAGLKDRNADPEIAEVLEETQSALGQAKVITSGMLSLSRAGGVTLDSVDLESAVAELVRILVQILPPAIRLTVQVPAGLTARSNRGFLQAALLNLALNARDAMPNGGDLCIYALPGRWDESARLAVGRTPPGEGVELSVADTGSGMGPEILAHIFDPLFSTKAKQRGHGLGLFMVQEFVSRSGAGLTVTSIPGEGTRFSLLLPPPGDLAGQDPPTEADAPVPRRPVARLRVLVVDDDPRVRDAVGRLLTLEGIDFAVAAQGADCLALLERQPGFDLVLSDIAMPVLDGIGLCSALARERPEAPRDPDDRSRQRPDRYRRPTPEARGPAKASRSPGPAQCHPGRHCRNLHGSGLLADRRWRPPLTMPIRTGCPLSGHAALAIAPA